MLICKKKVREYALAHAKNGRVWVGQSFIDSIEGAVRDAIERRCTHHDNVRGKRITLK
tara:strand:+ start:365 stop:538 length:174 start_codon:yes stop_codon:yes gene_type:complete